MYDTDVYEAMILLLAKLQLGDELYNFFFVPASMQHFIKV